MVVGLFLQAAVGDLFSSAWIGNRAAPSVYGLAAFRPGSAISVSVQLFNYLIFFTDVCEEEQCRG